MLKIEILDEDLKELILKGKNSRGKYKRFVSRLSDIYNLMRSLEHVSRLKEYSFLHYEQLKHISLSSVRIINGMVERLLFKEIDDGIKISLIEINENHYGNKK